MRSLVLLAPLSIALMLTSTAGAAQPAADKNDAAMNHAGMAGMDHGSMDSSGGLHGHGDRINELPHVQRNGRDVDG